jgi:hypothetical protein
MQDDEDRRPAAAGTNARHDRLKLALRENLKRRKAQARGRSKVASSESHKASLDDADDQGPH